MPVQEHDDQPQPRPVSRRIFLKGAGVAMALPWLESLPVWGSAAPTGASPTPKRFIVQFMGCGVSPDM